MNTGRRARVVALLSGWATASRVVPALAEEPTPAAPPVASTPATATDQTGQAADLYDEATRLYEAGQYAAASEKYLEADALVPSSEALSNAIATARKADAPLLVARAAQRAIARELLDPALAARARVALSEVEPQLKQLETRPQEAPATPEPAVRHKPAREPPAPPDPPAPTRHPGAPPYVFWIGVGATGVLTAITTWSGLEALTDKETLPNRTDPNYATATEDVNDSAKRTDWLLAATLVTGASTAAVGIWAVDWGDGNSMQVGAAPVVGGATVRWWGHFQ